VVDWTGPDRPRTAQRRDTSGARAFGPRKRERHDRRPNDAPHARGRPHQRGLDGPPAQPRLHGPPPRLPRARRRAAPRAGRRHGRGRAPRRDRRARLRLDGRRLPRGARHARGRRRVAPAADTAEAARRVATDVLGYASTTADYREVLANPEVDVVSICAPNFLHAEIGVAAARAGKHFWIEKPVGRGAADTAAVRDAAIEAGVATSKIGR